MSNSSNSLNPIEENNTGFLKNIIKNGNIINFYVKKKIDSEIPVNFKTNSNNSKVIMPDQQKIEKILQNTKRKSTLPPLTELYDN